VVLIKLRTVMQGHVPAAKIHHLGIHTAVGLI
jgi:hypothetical protein